MSKPWSDPDSDPLGDVEAWWKRSGFPGTWAAYIKEGMMDDKYVVFKRADWEAHNEQYYGGCMEPSPPEVEDAVVIRRQDVFAPPALDAYANAITTAIEVIAANAQGWEDSDICVSLKAVADYFHEQARIAWETNRKLPD